MVRSSMVRSVLSAFHTKSTGSEYCAGNSWIRFGIAIVFWLLGIQPVFVASSFLGERELAAQESKATAETANSADSNSNTSNLETPTPGNLEAAKKAMREHMKKIAQTITQFRLSEDEDTDEKLRAVYQQLLIEGIPIANELQKQVVLDARTLTGKEQEEKSKFIFELFMQNSDLDHYEHNWDLAQYLIDIGYEDKKREIYSILGRNALALNDFGTARKFYEKAVSIDVFSEDERRIASVLTDATGKWQREQDARQRDEEKGDLPRVVFNTTKGRFVIELFEDEAPNTVGNFIHLVEKGFYDDKLFHRVEKHLVAQAGCPNGDGSGGPGYTIQGENGLPNSRNHFRGSVAMALSGNDTNSGGSQFYVGLVPLSFLDGRYTVFGRIVEGMGIIEHLNRVNLSEKPKEDEPKLVPDRILDAKVLRKRNHDYVPEYATPPNEGEG